MNKKILFCLGAFFFFALTLILPSPSIEAQSSRYSKKPSGQIKLLSTRPEVEGKSGKELVITCKMYVYRARGKKVVFQCQLYRKNKPLPGGVVKVRVRSPFERTRWDSIRFRYDRSKIDAHLDRGKNKILARIQIFLEGKKYPLVRKYDFFELTPVKKKPQVSIENLSFQTKPRPQLKSTLKIKRGKGNPFSFRLRVFKNHREIYSRNFRVKPRYPSSVWKAFHFPLPTGELREKLGVGGHLLKAHFSLFDPREKKNLAEKKFTFSYRVQAPPAPSRKEKSPSEKKPSPLAFLSHPLKENWKIDRRLSREWISMSLYRPALEREKLRGLVQVYYLYLTSNGEGRLEILPFQWTGGELRPYQPEIFNYKFWTWGVEKGEKGWVLRMEIESEPSLYALYQVGKKRLKLKFWKEESRDFSGARRQFYLRGEFIKNWSLKKRQWERILQSQRGEIEKLSERERNILWTRLKRITK